MLPLTMIPLVSKAPMSTTLLTIRANPRWSVVMPAGIRALLPASMAGLSRSSAMVSVGPPLLASGPSCGLSGAAMVPVRSEPTQPELPSVSPIRLLPLEAKVPRASGPLVLAVFTATRVLPRVAVPTLYRPPPLLAELPLMVQLVSVMVQHISLW